VRCNAIERAAQKEPPVDGLPELGAGQFQRSIRPPTHRRHLVGGEVQESLGEETLRE